MEALIISKFPDSVFFEVRCSRRLSYEDRGDQERKVEQSIHVNPDPTTALKGKFLFVCWQTRGR